MNTKFVVVPKRRRPFGRPGSRSEGNIKMVLKEVMFEDANRIHLAQDRNS
jgi:hypothetical protein